MNPQTFMMWKEKFDKEMTRKKATEEEERLKALSAKEREEFKKHAGRLSGTYESNCLRLSSKLIMFCPI